MIKIRNLSKSFRDREIFNILNLNFKAGKVFALIGPNGAGKTTLMRKVLRLYLGTAGYEVVEAVDGLDALEALKIHKINLMILDIMMPKMDGFQLIEHLEHQEEERDFPIIFLSARTQVHDKIRGLTLGVDDYIEKPYDPGKVLARVMVDLRRTHQEKEIKSKMVKVGDLSRDLTNRQIYKKGELLELRAKEYQLLTLFMKHPG